MSEYEEYVEKYAIKHNISKEEAEKHEMVKEVWRYYQENKSQKKHVLG